MSSKLKDKKLQIMQLININTKTKTTTTQMLL